MLIPASRNSRLVTSLSIAAAEASTPAPTQAILAARNRPCSVPSSPVGPWTIGKATSISNATSPVATSMIWPVSRPGTTASSVSLAFRAIRFGSSGAWTKSSASAACQTPALSMPMTDTANRSRSRAATILRAEASETSCSAEAPPQITATRILSSLVWLIVLALD